MKVMWPFFINTNPESESRKTMCRITFSLMIYENASIRQVNQNIYTNLIILHIRVQ